jgi:hypothetical protein
MTYPSAPQQRQRRMLALLSWWTADTVTLALGPAVEGETPTIIVCSGPLADYADFPVYADDDEECD